MARTGKRLGPGSEHIGENACVLVIGRHLDGSSGQPQASSSSAPVLDLFQSGRLLCCGLLRTRVGQQLEVGRGNIEGAKARRAEEDDCVLDTFAAEAGERFLVLGHDAENAGIGRVEKLWNSRRRAEHSQGGSGISGISDIVGFFMLKSLDFSGVSFSGIVLVPADRERLTCSRDSERLRRCQSIYPAAPALR